MICPIYKQARAKSLAVPCIVLESIPVTDETGEVLSTIEIVKGNKLTESCIGIHRDVSGLDSDDRDSAIEDALQVAFRDGFERIYVYGGVK